MMPLIHLLRLRSTTLNFMPFHLLHNFDPRNKTCAYKTTLEWGVVVKVLEKEDVENLYLRCSLMKFQVFEKQYP